MKEKRRGRQKKRWVQNVKQWAGIDFASSARAAEDRNRQKGILVKFSVVPDVIAGLMEKPDLARVYQTSLD